MNALFRRTAILIGICINSCPSMAWPLMAGPLSVLISTGSLWGICQAAESFPYQAEVRSEMAEVMSGPGDSFYATDRLNQGTTVEVHRHESGDWCAIRPPAGSFSWVPVEMLEVEPDGIHARVVSDDAFTYVGSKFSTAHHVEYIPLEPGEQLRLLGTKVLTDPQTRKQREWAQVAPPDGEFRWIHRRHLGPVASPSSVARQRPAASAHAPISPATSSAEPSRVTQAAHWTSPSEPLSATAADRAGAFTNKAAIAEASSEPDGSPLTAPPQPLRSTQAPDLSTAPDRAPAPNLSTAPRREYDSAVDAAESNTTVSNTREDEDAGENAEEDMWRPRGSSTGTSMPATPASAIETTPSEGLAEPVDDRSSAEDSESSQAEETVAPLEPLTDATELADQIRALDLQLSAMVAQPVETWDLAALRGAVSSLAEQTTSDPRADNYLRNLDRRMAQFERVQQRYQKLALSARSTGSAQVNGPSSAATPRLIDQHGQPRRIPAATMPAATLPSTNLAATRRSSTNRPAAGTISGVARDRSIVPAAAAVVGDERTSYADAGDSAFDGEGILMPVFTSRTDIPEFALTDRRGRILQFVSAAEGIELREFVRQRVGVYGTHGFLPALQQQHLTATRVVVLADDNR